MALRNRVERLEKEDNSGGDYDISDLMRAAEEQLSRLYKMNSQALLQLVCNESEPNSARVSGIGLLLTREIDDKTRLSLLEMEQVMTQFDLVEAQEREVTAVTKKGRKLQERMNQGSIRVAAYRLEEIRMKILEIHA